DGTGGTTRKRVKRARACLGVIPARVSAAELGLIREIARNLKSSATIATVVVLGRTLDDLGLMRFGNVFVSGAVRPAELPRLARQYGIAHVLAGFGEPLFGHPLIDAALGLHLPTATVDWSDGRQSSQTPDLTLRSTATDREAAAAVTRWLSD